MLRRPDLPAPRSPRRCAMSRIPAWAVGLALVAALAAVLCSITALRQAAHAPTLRPYAYDLPDGWTPPPVPAGSVPVTEASVALGRALFYDTKLTNDGKTTCATCHEQARAFTNGKRTGVDASGHALEHNTISLVNAGYASLYTWADPSITTIEQELAMTPRPPEAMDRLRADPAYGRMFAEVFPGQADPFTWANTETALGAFVRTLISADTPYDRFARGDRTALSPLAQEGMGLFFSNNLACYTCHVDVPRQAGMPTWAAQSHQHNGVTADGATMLVPALRNVAVTGPYMHDGRFSSLEQVVRMYERGGDEGASSPHKNPVVSGFLLTDHERAALIAFLTEGLTDQRLLTDPAYGPPPIATPDH
ncbi:cytochrome-c peroxidase [Chloroflexia bacterium SDU3-3]|nr:cytochrome-c peroxidase [Chloroflexia bacterium SDU3-3]